MQLFYIIMRFLCAFILFLLKIRNHEQFNFQILIFDDIPRMTKEERHNIIIDKVRIKRRVSSNDLSEELEVSKDTVRRDLEELSSLGLLTKVHGGAVSTVQKLYHYNENAIFDHDNKLIVAKKTISLIKDGMVVIMSGGTTNLLVAKLLPPELKATFYTYSLPIALQLTEHPNIEIIFIGGKILKKPMVTAGVDVIQFLANIKADLCLLGVSGMSAQDGITEEGYEVSLIKNAMIKSSDKIVSLVTSNKLNVRQNYPVCDLKTVDVVVTDLPEEDENLSGIAEAGIQLL